MIVATILAMSTLVFTIIVLLNIALGVIAAAGWAHLLTDGGAGRFYCSRFWLSDFLKRLKERITFRKLQVNSCMLPWNWKELVHDMVLPAVFLVVTFTIPPQLFVKLWPHWNFVCQGSFLGNDNIGDNGVANEEDDNAPELSNDISYEIITRVNSETWDIATKEADEEEEVEDELVAAVGAQAQSGKTSFN